MQAEITAAWLLARTELDEESGCLVWTGCSFRNVPRTTLGGKAKTVRRVVWSAMHGREPRKGFRIQVRCSTPNCVDPACVVERRYNEWAAGAPRPIAVRLKISTGKRSASHLTEEAIADMRASTLTQMELAKKWDTTQTHVSKIVRQAAWRDYSSPFAGLGAQR